MGHWRTILWLALVAGVVSCSSSADRRLKWNLKTTVRQYEKTGRHDPKWDAPTKGALTLYAQWRCGARTNDPGDELSRQIGSQCQEAVAAGCLDPLVLYIHTRFVVNQPGRSETEIATAHRQVAGALKASRYDSLRKFYGFLRAGEHLDRLQPVPKLDVTEMMNDAAAQLAIALEANDAPAVELQQAARAFMQAFQRMDINRNWGWGKLAPLLQARWGANYRETLTRGEVNVD